MKRNKRGQFIKGHKGHLRKRRGKWILCKVCGVKFWRYNSQISRKTLGEGTYCSIKCRWKDITSAPKWRGGISFKQGYRRDYNVDNAIKWQKENPKRHYEAVQRYRKKNRLKVIAWKHRRRVRENNGGEVFSIQEWEELLKKTNYKCVCCGRGEPEIQLSVDHIVPLSGGGGNEIDNIQPLCLSCNKKKHTKIIRYGEQSA